MDKYERRKAREEREHARQVAGLCAGKHHPVAATWYPGRDDERVDPAQVQNLACLRRFVLKTIRSFGFTRERVTSGASAYYVAVKGDKVVRVRVSDHAVPMTDEREGRFTWARDGWNFVLNESTSRYEVLRQLVELRSAGAAR